jgi:carbon-monoxide dehydrogenase medium subunit
MIPAPFDYVRAATLQEALERVARHGDDAKVLAGGHSLLPAMKLRLAQPKVLVDIGRIGELRGIRETEGGVFIGALATHAEIEADPQLRKGCPLMPETAASIGDLQVRNRGTIGGSVAHADPAADWPAALLALDAEIEAASVSGRRRIPARDYFLDLFTTALKPGELVTGLRIPRTGPGAAYEKFAQKASGFAICGVAACVERGGVRIGVTGVAAKPYRASAVEELLAGKVSKASIAAASTRAAEGMEALEDIHASAPYRSHLAGVMARRALERALSRA